MRTRRSFQPMLNAMPSRFVPSSVGGAAHIVLHVGTATTDDTDDPVTVGASPIIIAPVISNPTTLMS
jgi:hypothetical protein